MADVEAVIHNIYEFLKAAIRQLEPMRIVVKSWSIRRISENRPYNMNSRWKQGAISKATGVLQIKQFTRDLRDWDPTD